MLRFAFLLSLVILGCRSTPKNLKVKKYNLDSIQDLKNNHKPPKQWMKAKEKASY